MTVTVEAFLQSFGYSIASDTKTSGRKTILEQFILLPLLHRFILKSKKIENLVLIRHHLAKIWLLVI